MSRSDNPTTASAPVPSLSDWVHAVASDIIEFRGPKFAMRMDTKNIPHEIMNGILKGLQQSSSSSTANTSSSATAGRKGKKRGGGKKSSDGQLVEDDEAPPAQLARTPQEYGPVLARHMEELHSMLSNAASSFIDQKRRSLAGNGTGAAKNRAKVEARDDLTHLIDVACCVSVCRCLISIQADAELAYRAALKQHQSALKSGDGKAVAASRKALKSSPPSYLKHVFQLLLYAFDHFSTQHQQDRTRYNLEDVGWDVPLLVQLVRLVTGVVQCRSALELEAREESGDDDLLGGTFTSSGGSILGGGDEEGAADGNSDGGSGEEAIGNINRTWRKLYIFCQDADTSIPDRKSRRRGTIIVVNGLLTILLHVHNTTLCQRLLSSVEHTENDTERKTSSLFAACAHIRAEIGKFHFYRGKFYFGAGNYQASFQALKTAWEFIGGVPSAAAATSGPTPVTSLTPQHQVNNEAKILFFWFSCAIVLGFQFPDQLVAKNPEVSALFLPIQGAISAGNVHDFVSAIDSHRELFRANGVYFALLGARKLVYLHLLKRVYGELDLISKTNSDIDPTRVSIPVLAAAVENQILRSSDQSSGSCGEGAPAYDIELQMFQEDISPEKKRRVESSGIIIVQGGQNKVLPVGESSAVAGGSGNTQNPPQNRIKIVDSVTLWVARLISEGWVRGYVSYEHLFVVLSRKEPFPARTL